MRLYEFIKRPPELINKTADVDGILVSINTNAKNASVYATSNGRRLGYVEFDRDGEVLVPYDLAVDDKYRGQGIAAVMYDYVKSLGFTIRASTEQTDAGKYFWSKNRGEERVWEDTQTPGEVFIKKIYSQFPDWPYGQADKVMVWGEGEEQQFAAFKLKPGTNPDTVEIDWLMAGPEQRQGVGSRAIKELQRQAQEDNIRLTLYPWAKGQISQASLTKLYKRHGFKPVARGAKPMAWNPELKEIARLPKKDAGDFGEKGTITAPKHAVKKTPLPGGSGFTYAVDQTGQGNIEIMIFDGETLAAEMDLFDTQDFMKTWRVDTVVVDPDYRGRGLGKALYGIALSILRLTIEAGETQTSHGQQMWLMLNSIPGVEVVGYNMEPTDKYQARPGDKVVDQNADWTRYTFPVEAGSRSMRSGRRGTGIYTSHASMIAKWTGR